MKVGICSDLHMEFRKTDQFLAIVDNIQRSECDLLINAGDTHPKPSTRDFISSSLEEGKKFYLEILGNHDFYGDQMIHDGIKIMVLPNGLKVLGCTFWTDFNSGDPAAERSFQYDISDSKQIAPYGRALIERMQSIHKANLDGISKIKPDIVVTHHCPSFKSIQERYKWTGPLNYSFASHEDNFIRANPNIKLWVCGHTHWKHTYQIGETRIVCNPLGYPGEIYQRDSDYEVEIIDVD
jgi:predicted phosphodiesterase